MNTFLLEIVTPEKVAFAEKVEEVVAPAVDGQVGILAHHTPYFTLLAEGELKVVKDNEEIFLSLGEGFLEVTPFKTTILVTKALHADEINEEEVKKAKEMAEKAIKEGIKGEALISAQALLRSSLIDYKIAQRRVLRSQSRKL